jgi:glycerate 2-kinase
MKILIAPDKFKGSLNAAEVASAIADGLRSVDPELDIDLCPLADGGEGTVEALVAATGGRIITQKVTGPLPRMKVDAPIGLLGSAGAGADGDERTAVIEMAAASGMSLLTPEQRDPMRTTTYGTGELMRAAADLGVRRIILGIGGSATIDGGVGAAQAWGAKFTLISGQSYTIGDRRLSGGDLERLLRVEGNHSAGVHKPPLQIEDQSDGGALVSTRPALVRKRAAGKLRPQADRESLRLDARGIEFVVACDVGNPLLGRDGAAAVFGPQKGATPEQIDQLEAGLRKLVEKTGCFEEAVAPGAGAAGGLGFGMRVFFGATLRSGIDIVIEATRLRDRLTDVDLCITGEGRLDAQTLNGKTVVGVAKACQEAGVPCIALAGMIAEGADALLSEGLGAYHAIADRPMTIEESMRDGRRLLTRAAANILRTNLARRYTSPWTDAK